MNTQEDRVQLDDIDENSPLWNADSLSNLTGNGSSAVSSATAQQIMDLLDKLETSGVGGEGGGGGDGGMAVMHCRTCSGHLQTV